MKNVDYSLNTTLSELEKCQKDAAKAEGLTSFVSMRHEILRGNRVDWLFTSKGHEKLTEKVVAEYNKLFDVNNKGNFNWENLNKIYIGGKPYPEECKFDVKRATPEIIMLDIMNYVNESAFQKKDDEGKLTKPLVMFKSGNKLEPVDINTKKIEAPFNPFTRAWYSLINWISGDRLFKEEVAQIKKYNTVKESYSAKKSQFEIDKKFVTTQEIENQRPEKIKQKEMLEVYKNASLELFKGASPLSNSAVIDEAYFGSNTTKNASKVEKAAAGTDFISLSRSVSRCSLCNLVMLDSGKTLNQVFDPSDTLKDARSKTGQDVIKMLETKNYDQIYKIVATAGKNLGNETLDMPTSNGRNLLTTAGRMYYKCVMAMDLRQMLPKTLENNVSAQTKEKYKNDFDESMSLFSDFANVGGLCVNILNAVNDCKNFQIDTDKVAIDRIRSSSLAFEMINPKKEASMTIKNICGGLKQIIANHGGMPQSPDNAEQREQFIQQFLSDFPLKPSAAPQRELVNLLGEKEAAPKRQPSPEKKKTEMTMTK